MILGVMQGRLTNKGGFFPQDFPWKNWEYEFEIASTNSISCIEWMFNYDNWENNPLITKYGVERILSAIRRFKVSVNSVCSNYYMDEGIFKNKGLYVFERLCEHMSFIGAHTVIIPLFKDNEPLDRIDEQNLMRVLEKSTIIADLYKIRVAIETDWSLQKIYHFIHGIDNIGICYDIGNSAGHGKNIIGEIIELGELIINVHVKDKKLGGDSVMFGEGVADIKGAMSTLRELGYNGNVILESYYRSNAVEDTLINLDFINRCLL